jgi:hypothetical protein
LLACWRQGLVPTQYLLAIRIAEQTLSVFERCFASPRHCGKPSVSAAARGWSYRRILRFSCSTSRFGIGQVKGSNRTPLGLHRIVEKIGGGWPVGTVFKSRQVVGYTWKGFPNATITTRILWLEGLEPGLNRGGDVDSHARYIYIHGTGDETTLGRPASYGCIHLAANDLIPLYDKLPIGTLVWIGR